MKRIFLCLFTIAYFAQAADEKPAPPPAVSDKVRADFMQAVAGESISRANYDTLFKRWEADLAQRIQDINTAQQAKLQATYAAQAECAKTTGWTLDERAAQQNVLACVQIPAPAAAK